MAQGVVTSLQLVLHKLATFPDKLSVPYPKSEIESLRDGVSFLMNFLKKEENVESIPDLEKQIIDAAYEAEDIIEPHMSTNLLLPSDSALGEENFVDNKLQKVLQKFESIRARASKVDNFHRGREDPAQERPSQPFVLSRFLEANKKVVGREDELMKIKDQVIESSSKLKVVAVVGMIGIGKTTLVNEVYNDPLVANTFDYQAWVTVGPKKHVREILLSLVKLDPDSELSNEELEICLDRILHGRRYFIVLDDVRNFSDWNNLRYRFPVGNKRGCIILTTRLRQFMLAASSTETFHEIRFLNEDESWDLLRYAAIGEEESCHHQLVKIGKTIALNCQGLPLKIITLGSLLSRMSPDPETC